MNRFPPSPHLRTVALATLLSLTFFVFASSAFAQVSYPNPLSVGTIPEFLALVLDGMTRLLIPIVIIFVIYAGYLFVTAQGDERKIASAKHALMWTLIGAAVILGAALMADILRDTLTQLR